MCLWFWIYAASHTTSATIDLLIAYFSKLYITSHVKSITDTWHIYQAISLLSSAKKIRRHVLKAGERINVYYVDYKETFRFRVRPTAGPHAVHVPWVDSLDLEK
jgi:hypothetical protein